MGGWFLKREFMFISTKSTDDGQWRMSTHRSQDGVRTTDDGHTRWSVMAILHILYAILHSPSSILQKPRPSSSSRSYLCALPTPLIFFFFFGALTLRIWRKVEYNETSAHFAMRWRVLPDMCQMGGWKRWNKDACMRYAFVFFKNQDRHTLSRLLFCSCIFRG